MVWKENGTFLDGHNRIEICRARSLSFTTAAMSFSSRDEAKLWVVLNQLGRRSLTNYTKSELVLQAEPWLSAQAKKRQLGTLKQGDKKPVPPKSTERAPSKADYSERETRTKLAKLAGVGHDTLWKVKVIVKQAPPEVKEKLRRGETNINREHKKIVATQRKAKRSASAQLAAQQDEEMTAAIEQRLRAGDTQKQIHATLKLGRRLSRHHLESREQAVRTFGSAPSLMFWWDRCGPAKKTGTAADPSFPASPV